MTFKTNCPPAATDMKNGGFAMPLVHRSLADLARTLGDADARALHLASVGAVHSLRQFVENQPCTSNDCMAAYHRQRECAHNMC